MFYYKIKFKKISILMKYNLNILLLLIRFYLATNLMDTNLTLNFNEINIIL